jgi:hypothetical protein
MLTWVTKKIKETLLQRNLIVFMHIQKTAGTSLVHMAARHYGNDNIITHGDYVGRPPESLMHIPFVSGHFGYDYAKKLVKWRKSFTFLRDPVERILSLYYFYRTQDPETFPMYRIAHESDLAEFLIRGLEDPLVKSRIWNNQTWQIAHGYAHQDNRGIEDFSQRELLDLALQHIGNFSFIGLAENFESDAAFVAKILGWQTPENNTWVNANQGRRTTKDLSIEEVSLLDELTILDRKLYRHVRSSMRTDLQ